MSIKIVDDFNFKGKRVLLRVDFNVPISKNRVTDDTRIKRALKTIRKIIDAGGRLVVMSHLGRPKGNIVKEYMMDPVGERLSTLLKHPVKKLTDSIGGEVEKAVAAMKDRDVILLENLRFHPGEKANDEGFAKDLAKLGDIYINDAFGTTHRAHASISGICKFIENKGMGYLIQKELENLSKAISNPSLPFLAILGGAKVSGKIDLINNISNKVDQILIGGGMMFTFLKANGYEIGNSLLEEDKLDLAKKLLDEIGNKLVIPTDVKIVDSIDNPDSLRIVKIEDMLSDVIGIDIGSETIKAFESKILKAKTVLFNGPMGIFEKSSYAEGTIKILEAIARAKCVSIIGGGDSAAAANKFGFENVFTHISTGGGASLEFLSGKPLPGIESLKSED
ncbi:phosphoglycerate kinase [Candidatus Dependentiae bacterium]|nr:phosphoglycerate kinase [Candidatus Dependentiae bacterium]